MHPCIRLLIIIALCASASALDHSDQLIKAGHWKRAKPLVEAAYARNPKDAPNLLLLAKIKRVYGDLEGAQKLTEQAVALDPNNFQAHFQLADIYGDQASKASLFRQMKLAGGLRRELETTVRLDPNFSDAHFGLMQYYLQAPGIAGGSKDKARSELAAIRKISAAQGFLAEAEFAQHEKQTGGLEELYRKAHEADPQNYDVTRTWCNYLLSQKNWPESEKCGLELLKLDRTRSSGHQVLALVYATQQRWANLDAALADSEKNVPDNLAAFFHAGRVLADSGADNARGERYLRHYLEQEPEPTAPKLSRAHWKLGQILEKQGRKPDAVTEYQAAIRLEPSFEPAQKDLKRLR